jgi:hypothetical protein
VHRVALRIDDQDLVDVAGGVELKLVLGLIPG